MQDKTLAFVGDSLGRQQFQSLMCMITGGKERPDVIDVGQEYGLVKLGVVSALMGGHFGFQAPTPLCSITGHHWNRGKLRANHWVIHVDGMPNTNKKLAMIGDAKNFTIHSIVNWVNKQLPKYPRLKAFYRSISPRHFVNGDWNTGGSCDNTTPMSVGKEVLQDESSDYSAGNAVKGTGVKLLDITALSQLRDEGHISRFSITASPGVQDCLHWCLPGVPDTWNEILFALISDMSKLQDE